ncbi:YmdB family metallophosphoesterase [candidate division KSB1 bacterium]|nr:YmdB family metallophosphoesterase [candidate division KSB1 bacterium]
MWPNKDRGAVRVLFVGDVCGKPGIEAVQKLLPGLLRATSADFCIVNGENAEQGKGMLPAQVQDIFHSGADVITGGNHTMYRDKIIPLLESDPRVLRPFNYPPNTIGRGSGVFDVRGGLRIGVVNLIGRALMTAVDDPFRLGKAEIERMRVETLLIVADFHAEASAEKLAFARYVDGLATAVVGTHTHVPTADNEILPGGTAFITDVGMTGPHSGVIGMKTEAALHRFLNPLGGGKSGVAEGDVRLNLALIDADPRTGTALAIERRQVKLTP